MMKKEKRIALALMVVCALITSILYFVELSVTLYCNPKIIRPLEYVGLHGFHDTFNESINNGSHDKEYGQPQNDTNDRRLSVPLLASDIENGSNSNSEGDTPTVNSLPFQSGPKFRTDDIMTNISLAELMHIIEMSSLNESIFLNWTESHMLRRITYFTMPPWVDKGANICDDDTEMIIIMPAIPSRVFLREIIRQTWASSVYGTYFPEARPNSLRTKIAFIFGTYGLDKDMKAALKHESKRYNDVVTADFVDSYRNLSLKMMVGLHWVSAFCSDAKYVMKADLDTFINLPLLSRFVLELSTKMPRFILGHRHMSPKHPVLRSGKWRVDIQDYPFDKYPPYVLGHSYVLTADLAPLLMAAGKRLPLVSAEDALITGILARVIEAPRVHYKGFACVFKKVVSCKMVHNYELTVTHMSVSRHILMWRDIITNRCSHSELPAELQTDSGINLDSQQNSANETAKNGAYEY